MPEFRKGPPKKPNFNKDNSVSKSGQNSNPYKSKNELDKPRQDRNTHLEKKKYLERDSDNRRDNRSDFGTNLRSNFREGSRDQAERKFISPSRDTEQGQRFRENQDSDLPREAQYGGRAQANFERSYHAPIAQEEIQPKLSFSSLSEIAEPTRDDEIIAGIHSVSQLLATNPERINQILLLQGRHPKLNEIQKTAEGVTVKVHQVPPTKLDRFYRGNHQGVIAICTGRPLDDWPQVKQSLLTALAKGEKPWLVLASAIEDPRNLGACIRSCAALGITVLLYPIKGSCGLTPAATKSAAGAAEQIQICRLAAVEREMQELHKAGFLFVGLDTSGSIHAHERQYDGPIIFVVGGEDRGIPPHIARNCNDIVKLPMSENSHSYNASVALSLLLYEASRSQGFQLKALQKL